MPRKAKLLKISSIKAKCPKCLHQFLPEDIKQVILSQQKTIGQLKKCLRRRQFEMELMQKAFSDIRGIITKKVLESIKYILVIKLTTSSNPIIKRL